MKQAYTKTRILYISNPTVAMKFIKKNRNVVTEMSRKTNEGSWNMFIVVSLNMAYIADQTRIMIEYR